MDLRKLSYRDESLLVDVISATTNPIIITDIDGTKFVNSIEEKKKVFEYRISNPLNTMQILFVWEGKVNTHVFELTYEDIEKILTLI